jgi:NDP-hexose-3-ketoreductase
MGFETMKPVKIGVIGCGKILYTALVLPAWQSQSLQIQGIASRSFAKAQSYAAQCKIPNVYQNYEDLLDDEALDLVYIALPNHLHRELIIKAAAAGKHILVEKPLCLSTAEFAAIQSACARHRVHLLEGIMVQHHPWQSYLKQYIAERHLGALQKLNTRISFIPKYDLTGNYRSHPECGGGCFFDLSPYWLQFIQAMIGLEPDWAVGWSDFSGSNQCDYSFWAKMRFGAGVEANLTVSFEQPYTARHELNFAKGRIIMADFFQANLGKRQVGLKIENWETGATEVVTFPPQNYYLNQLEFLVKVVTGATANIDLGESGRRVKLMELIYRAARQQVMEGGAN